MCVGGCVYVCACAHARGLKVQYIMVTAFLLMDRKGPLLWFPSSPLTQYNPQAKFSRLLCPSPIIQALRGRLPALLQGASALWTVTAWLGNIGPAQGWRKGGQGCEPEALWKLLLLRCV